MNGGDDNNVYYLGDYKSTKNNVRFPYYEVNIDFNREILKEDNNNVKYFVFDVVSYKFIHLQMIYNNGDEADEFFVTELGTKYYSMSNETIFSYNDNNNNMMDILIKLNKIMNDINISKISGGVIMNTIIKPSHKVNVNDEMEMNISNRKGYYACLNTLSNMVGFGGENKSFIVDCYQFVNNSYTSIKFIVSLLNCNYDPKYNACIKVKVLKIVGGKKPQPLKGKCNILILPLCNLISIKNIKDNK